MTALRSVLAALLVAGTAAAQDAGPEPVTIDAFSIWTATGSVIGTGAAAHAFAGELRGPYFIDTGEGPIPAGEIACVGVLEADDASGQQSASGRCRLVAADGAVAFGRFACEGWRLVGCVGRFEIIGGEGRLAGVTGEGPMTVRRYETSLAAGGPGAVRETALGIASWKGFRLNPPAAQ